VDRFGNDLSGLSFAVWGLAFKPGTDDMREASSIVLINELVKAGAIVRAYDPVAQNEARREFPPKWFEDKRLVLVEQPYDALDGASAMILVTEWKMFRQPDFDEMKERMAERVIFDGRNQYDPEEVRESGFDYSGIGR
jgi:UDPglucose 6-dehydrogenase